MLQPVRRIACWALVLAGATLLTTQTALAEKRLLRLRFDGPVTEAPAEEISIGALFGQQKAKSLRQWVTMIEKAGRDSDIDGIVMFVEQPRLGFAQVDELHRALRAFRAQGKPVYCYIDTASNLSYALASAADHITLAEYSALNVIGLRAELSFYKGLLAKIGVEADLLHVGAYKSALEPFTRTAPSKEAADNVNWLLDGIYERYVEIIAEARGLSPKEVRAAIDAAPLEAEAALERKLIDAVGSFPDFKRKIRKEFGKDVEIVKKLSEDDGPALDFSNPFAVFQMINEMMGVVKSGAAPGEPGIGLIYVDGAIVLGKSQANMLGMGSVAGSTTIRAALEKARADESVKAVVLRVNSPGGSALASDIIWEAATRCAAEKPLIVSMGNVAGSGGYYVALPGDTIFAERATITASIGVVGGKFVWSGLMEEKLGITTTEISRGKHAALMSMNQRWNDDERAWMTTYMQSVYDQFKTRINQSRGKRIKGDLEDLAGGRVFTGAQALEHGLIDRIGGLSDAIRHAAKKADLSDYEIYVFPKPKGFADILAMLMGEETEDEFEISTGPAFANDPFIRAALPLLRELAPEKLRSIAHGLRNAALLNREHVGCFMPFDLRVR